MIINENYLLGKAIKKRTPSASQVTSITTIDDIESVGELINSHFLFDFIFYSLQKKQ
jgi:hypothetical protein